MRPPAVLEWIVRTILPGGARGAHILGDLREEFAREALARGRWVAGAKIVVRALEVRRHMGWSRRGVARRGHTDGGGAMGGISTAVREIRLAGRALRRAPAFTLTATVTMALGLAAFTAVFAVLQAVLLEPPPFHAPDRLVALRVIDTDTPDGSLGESYQLSFPQFEDVRERGRAFSGMAAWLSDAPVLELGDGLPPLRVQATAVTGDFFSVAGIEPALGRTIQPLDEAAGASAVAVVSHSLWVNRFGADPSILGRTLSLNGLAFEIVGVVSASFTGTEAIGSLPSTSTDVWLPHANSWLRSGSDARGLHNVGVLARMAEIPVEAGSGTSLESIGAARAADELDRISAQLATEHEEHADEGVVAVPVRDLLTGDSRTPVSLLFAGCGIVLLLAMMNVVALTLGRASGRSAEMAVRQALGGGPLSRIRVLLAESLWIGGGGVALGALLTLLLLRLARLTDAGLLPRLERAELDLTTLFVLGVLGLGTALLVGMIPALSGRTPGATLRTSRGATRTGQRFRMGLVVLQMAGTIVLLSTSGLVLRSIALLRGSELGFDATGVLAVDLRMPTPFVSPDWPRHVDFFRTVAQELAAEPTVASVGLAYQGPTDGGWANGFDFSDRPAPPAGNGPSAIFRPIDAGYFETLGIPVVAGRGIETTDQTGSARVAVVNEAFARRFFESGESPVGTRIDYGDFWGAGPPEYEIVGVVADVAFNGPETPTSPAIYFAHSQQPVREMTVFARTRGEPLALRPVLETVVARLQPGLPLDDLTTVRASVDARIGPRRFLATILTALAGIAIVLALVGLYGVLSYGVETRRREIGIRLAIGADPTSVFSGILGRTLAVVATGVVLGAGVSLFTTTLLERFLFSVRASDPLTWGAAVVFLAATAVVTGWCRRDGPSVSTPSRRCEGTEGAGHRGAILGDRARGPLPLACLEECPSLVWLEEWASRVRSKP